MSETLPGLSADVLAPSRLGISEDGYRVLIKALVGEMQSCDQDAIGQAQMEEDVLEAEWMVDVLYRAGYVPVQVER